jgi:transposase
MKEEGEDEVRERTRAILGEFAERVFKYIVLSQTCSKCGVIDKESWAWSDTGLVRTCPHCGYREHE